MTKLNNSTRGCMITGLLKSRESLSKVHIHVRVRLSGRPWELCLSSSALCARHHLVVADRHGSRGCRAKKEKKRGGPFQFTAPGTSCGGAGHTSLCVYSRVCDMKPELDTSYDWSEKRQSNEQQHFPLKAIWDMCISQSKEKGEIERERGLGIVVLWLAQITVQYVVSCRV